jgi:hypothetical protein
MTLNRAATAETEATKESRVSNAIKDVQKKNLAPNRHPQGPTEANVQETSAF